MEFSLINYTKTNCRLILEELKFAEGKITIESVTGELDDFEGGEVEVKLSNNWYINLNYTRQTASVYVENHTNTCIFKETTEDCFTGMGVHNDIFWAITQSLNSVLGIK